jgi:hypothetical protein
MHSKQELFLSETLKKKEELSELKYRTYYILQSTMHSYYMCNPTQTKRKSLWMNILKMFFLKLENQELALLNQLPIKKRNDKILYVHKLKKFNTRKLCKVYGQRTLYGCPKCSENQEEVHLCLGGNCGILYHNQEYKIKII